MRENKINEERQQILEKIIELENQGYFDTDVENDPPSTTLMPNQIDYLHKKLKTKIMSAIVNKKAKKTIDNLFLSNQIIIKEVKGLENIKNFKESAFITSNHFHPFENIALFKTFMDNVKSKHKFYRVIREGNYTAPPKGLDLFFKYANTLPLSSNIHTMKKFMNAIEKLSKKHTFILMYPEQYMWYNYKKPRPFKDGVFKLSYKFNTPIIPCFITMQDSSEFYDTDNLPVQEYTIHIDAPIYPNLQNNIKNEVKRMKELNYNFCKNVYEKTYNKKLEFSFEKIKKDN